MRTAIFTTLAAVALLSGSLFAQDKREASPQANTTSAKTLIVFGRVSNDGHSLQTDLDSEWLVSNAQALKGYEGLLVRVRCYIDSAKNRLQILSVKKDSLESGYAAARHADSAFHR